MAAAESTTTIHSSVLFDPKQKKFLENISITINKANGSIKRVYERDESDTISSQDIDLRGKVVMPGLVDSHTHIFLHPWSERSSTEQMRDESAVERIVRATNHVRDALLAGFTTYRDLGTEALGSSDAGVRDCINRGIIPGPRLIVATHAVASTGSYEIRVESRANGLVPPQASEVGDGPDGVRRAVRRRVGDGADIIKFYADYRRKALRFPDPKSILFPPAGDASPSVPLFTQEEMNAIVQEAKLAELPVAAHSGTAKAGLMACKAGVTSLEHGTDFDDEVLKEMARRGCIFVPTLAVFELAAPELLRGHMQRTKRAFDLGVRLAAGGDTGTFPHGESARELELMMASGLAVEDVLEACMVGGWEACGGDLSGYRFGWLAEGNRADIIALDADPREDRRALRKVSFVMKDGRVWKENGTAVDMAQGHEWPAEDPEWVIT